MHSGDIVCGDYSGGVLDAEVCINDPAANYSCELTTCDFYDTANNCYRYHNIPATFLAAESTCLLRGGHIAYNPDDRVVEAMVEHMGGLQTPVSSVWLGVRSKLLCEYESIDGAIETGSSSWGSGFPTRCLASADGGCTDDWATTAVSE